MKAEKGTIRSSRPVDFFAVFGLVVLLSGVGVGFSFGQQPLRYRSVCIQGACVNAEIADTPKARIKGLMGRTELTDGQGMLFIFESSDSYGFWMKNMLFAIDIIWISEDSSVVAVQPDVLPCGTECPSYDSGLSSAKFVLEVPAGFAQKHKIKIGDRVVIQ